MDNTQWLYLISVIVVSVSMIALITFPLSRIFKIKKYWAEVKKKNQAWLKKHGLNDTTNRSIMHHFFDLKTENIFSITKIDHNLQYDEVLVTFLIKNKEVTISLDINETPVILLTDQFPLPPKIRLIFPPSFLDKEYLMDSRTWEEAEENFDPYEFLDHAAITLFMSHELFKKIINPLYQAEETEKED